MNPPDDRLTIYGSFTSSSSYKPILYLALARLPYSFRTVNLKIGVQKSPEYLAVNRWGVVPSLRHRGLTILQSNVILDYLARTTGHFEPAAEQQRWQAREWLAWEADHITAVNAFDTDAIVATFAEDAYVNDNRREIWGTEAIRAFMAKEFVGDHVTMEVREVLDHYGDIIVRARYDGTYDKANLPDELVMTSYFGISDNRIVSLAVIFNQPSPY